MDVLDDMTLIQKNKRPVTLSPGQYQASLSFKKKKVTLELRQDDWKKKFQFKIPAGLKSTLNGDFMLNPVESGWPYAIVARNKQEESHSHPVKDEESCIYRTPYYFCGHHYCSIAYRLRWGVRYVEYRVRTEVRTTSIDVIDSGNGDSNDVLAHLEASHQDSERVYDDYGRCRNAYTPAARSCSY